MWRRAVAILFAWSWGYTIADVDHLERAYGPRSGWWW